MEIIRCKDCKFAEHWYGDKMRCFLWHADGIGVFEDGFCNYAERRQMKDVLKDVFLHGETHADVQLYMIHYVKYQSDGREYHSKDRYIFGKRAATEHYEKVFQWLHSMYCKDIIKDYTIGMHQIY